MSDSFGDKQAGRDNDRSTEVNSPNPVGEQNLEASWQEVDAVFSDSPEVAATEPVNPLGSVAATPPDRSRQFDPSTPLITVETAFLASASSLIWLVNFYFPMGPLLRIFFPIPIALTYLRWGSRAAWMGALVSGLLLSVLMGPARSVLFVMPFGFMGVMLGTFWHRRAAWSLSVFAGSLLGAFGFFFRVWLVSLMLGDDLWLYATTQVTDLLEWIFVRLGLLFQPTLLQVQAAVVLMIWLNNLVYLFVVHLVAWFLLDRLGNPIPRPPKWVQVLMDYE
jgi:uncharacterized protein YybS (DUF2232 family)